MMKLISDTNDQLSDAKLPRNTRENEAQVAV